MITVDLTRSAWQLRGWRPYTWQLRSSMELGFEINPDIPARPISVPGSVQAALKADGLLPDWNTGLQSLQCEWVEKRHWEFFVEVTPPASFRGARLVAEMLDHSGWVLVDGRVAAEFCGGMVRQSLDLGSCLRPAQSHILSVVFDTTPEEQGQAGFTSRSRHFKPRFSYGWDWCPRFVPIGIGGPLEIRFDPPGLEIESVQTSLDDGFTHGTIEVRYAAAAATAGKAVLTAFDGVSSTVALAFSAGRGNVCVQVPGPALWWPNGAGPQPLYHLEIRDTDGAARWSGEVGFKKIRWLACEGAPPDAEPWICEVNGRPVFLQGVNWTPVSLDYLGDTRADIVRLTGLYRELGCNLLRVWGGAFLGSEEFFRAADRAGLMVWQEFPLSSSGIDNWPPEDPCTIDHLEKIATDHVRRRAHHTSLLLWCGGNELQSGKEGKTGAGYPCNISHPCLRRMGEVVARETPGVRYLPTSASGPRFMAEEDEFGRGLHHDVHGPWKLTGSLEDWRRYWEKDDSLFRSETGSPGTMLPEQIRRYAGEEPVWPPDPTTLYWMHTAAWWCQMEQFETMSPGPRDLETYCAWSRQLQAEALAIAADACKQRFPRCGGFLVWMGHDCFPCPANTSVIDLERNPKPAYHALRAVFQEPARIPGCSSGMSVQA